MSNERVTFAASSKVASEAAEQAVLAGASALGTVVWAYLSAAAASPGVLLSPLSILLAGFGARRALDGRVRQAGLGAARPRGFKDDEAIPEAAYVGIPTSLAAIFVALSYDERQVRSSALRAAVGVANRAGALARASVLEHANAAGAAAFRAGDVERAMLRCASPAEGGLVTREDFAAVPELDQLAPLDAADLVLPWDLDAASGQGEAGSERSEAHAIVAIDRRGTGAVLCYEDALRGVAILDGQLLCPKLAVPVRRGVPRVTPGQPLPQRCGATITFAEPGLVMQAGCDRVGVRVVPPR